jgi:hypothetical protein
MTEMKQLADFVVDASATQEAVFDRTKTIVEKLIAKSEQK